MKLAANLPESRLDKTSNVPLFRRLYAAIKGIILGSQLRPGAQLSPSRNFAKLLGVFR